MATLRIAVLTLLGIAQLPSLLLAQVEDRSDAERLKGSLRGDAEHGLRSIRDRGADETLGIESDESREIRERIRLYLNRHGDNGRIDAEDRRRRVAADYEERRRDRVQTLAVGGTNWVSIGPTNGAGRMIGIAPHPIIFGTLYAGAADGGVWKTTDGGSSWTPLTDGINDLSIGAVALAPSSPNIIYAGTGEGGYGVDFIPGIGLLKSTDSGSTWTIPPSVIATEFYKISVHPTNPLELVVGTNQGGQRSIDGGTSWTTVISRTTYGDVTDIVRDPTNPQVLYAALDGVSDERISLRSSPRC